MTAAELRFEAIYYGVLGVMCVAVLVVRFDWDVTQAAVGGAVGAVAAIVALALSTRGDGPRGRERTQRMVPLLILLALLTLAAGRGPATVAAACMAGWAVGALALFLLWRRAV